MLRQLLLAALCLAGPPAPARACQLPSEWRPLSEGCRAELAETIVYARVLALHPEAPGLYNHLPWQYHAGQGGLFYSAEVEMLCDQAWGSMLEVPAGSRLNLTGLGYFSCHSHTVVQDYSYFFFLRMDENYNLLPHGVNFQDAIFPDTQENRRMFSSLFQFSNCSQGQQLATFSSDWEIQEDNRVIPALNKPDEEGGRSRVRLFSPHQMYKCFSDRWYPFLLYVGITCRHLDIPISRAHPDRYSQNQRTTQVIPIVQPRLIPLS
uniref:Coiled-coil domain containing 3 n=1 Tax=Macaca mulatta TaxID=9544 RepID=A0A5F8A5B8_MACMU